MADAQSTLIECGYDALERMGLDSVRWLCIGYALHDLRGHEATFEIARRGLGEELGIRFAARVSDLMLAIRRDRPSPFRFNDPACPACRHRIAPHERSVIDLVRAMRRRRPAEAEVCAMIILEGCPAQPLLRAAAAVGDTMSLIDRANVSHAQISKATDDVRRSVRLLP